MIGQSSPVVKKLTGKESEMDAGEKSARELPSGMGMGK